MHLLCTLATALRSMHSLVCSYRTEHLGGLQERVIALPDAGYDMGERSPWSSSMELLWEMGGYPNFNDPGLGCK